MQRLWNRNHLIALSRAFTTKTDTLIVWSIAFCRIGGWNHVPLLEASTAPGHIQFSVMPWDPSYSPY